MFGLRGRGRTVRGWGSSGVGAIILIAGLFLTPCRERAHAPPPANEQPAAPSAAPVVRVPPAPRPPPSRSLVLLHRDTTLVVLPLGPDTVKGLGEVGKPVPAPRVVAAAVNAITGSRTIQWPAGVVGLQLTDHQHGTFYTTTFPALQASPGRL